jgi:phosphohistidine phosphatase
MDVYLLRHGKAEDHSADGTDRSRKLTPEGVEAMMEEVPGIKNMVKKIDYVLTSPYPRAMETARIAASAFGLEKKVEELDGLSAPDAGREVTARINELPVNSAVMLVGHSPLLGELIEYLTGSPEGFNLKKGGLCKISFPKKPERGKGKFEWLLKPRDLKQ